MLNRIRRRLDAAVARRVDLQLSQRIDSLLEERHLDVESVTRRWVDYEARLGGLQADYSFVRSEFDRIAPQLSALEARFEHLRSRSDRSGDDSTSLIQAQQEHERVRLRLEIVSQYEERLRRLEETDHV